jgi:hypothetical protein
VNVAFEFASVEYRPDLAGRYLLWIGNGPVAVEVDLWRTIELGETARPVCDFLLREITRLLTADEPTVGFVPSVDDRSLPWQVGVRLDAVRHIQGFEPSAREEEAPGETVIRGDPAYRIVIADESDSVTLRTDRMGLEALATACRRAMELRRSESERPG